MTQMSVARGTAHFDPHHAMRNVAMFDHGVKIGRRGKTWPARSAVIFAVRFEQQCPATGAMETAVAFFVSQPASGRSFGSGFAKNMILNRVQLGAPFGVGLFDFGHKSPFEDDVVAMLS
jgi:hypothetical protein